MVSVHDTLEWKGNITKPTAAANYFVGVLNASGTWGCRAVWGPFWFQLEWADLLQGAHISIKELAPIVIVTAVWGHHWKGKPVRVLSDNSAAVAAINNQSSRVKETAHLLRCLAFIAGRLQIHLSASHLPGVNNSIADAFSRNNLSLFFVLHPQASRSPSPIPSSLIQLLLLERPNWTSQHWTMMWSNIFPHRPSTVDKVSIQSQN